jgi:hypothetical protein
MTYDIYSFLYELGRFSIEKQDQTYEKFTLRLFRKYIHVEEVISDFLNTN